MTITIGNLNKVIIETEDEYYDRQFSNILNLPDITQSAIEKCKF